MQWVSTPQAPIRVDDDEGDGDGRWVMVMGEEAVGFDLLAQV